MAASYPGAAKTFTPLVDAVDYPQATQINQAYDEIAAIEVDLLAGTLYLPSIQDGRLTATSGTPVTTTDVSGAASIYFTPFDLGNRISLYDGSARWKVLAFTEITIALAGLTASTPYDIFAYNNSGSVAIETVAWTNVTTRATALVRQDGVLVKSGATTRRYLGSVYINSTGGQTDDSVAKRYLFNYDHRDPRKLLKSDTTGSYTYTTATVRQARADATNQVEVMVGWSEDALTLTATATSSNSTAGAYGVVGIGEDSTTAIHADCVSLPGASAAVSSLAPQMATLVVVPAVGWHKYTWLEWAQAAGTMTWWGSGWGPASLRINGLLGTFRA